MEGRSDTGIVVERSHRQADRFRIFVEKAYQRRAANLTESTRVVPVEEK
jgi:hypothetical protein